MLGIPQSLNDLWEFQPNTNGQLVTATPSFSPGAGSYSTWQSISITDPTPGATVYYSVNGATYLTKYAGPIAVSASESIEAIAQAKGYANSNIATAAYAADYPQASAPTFNPVAGNYASSRTVSISSSTPGAAIYYSIGAVPTYPSTLYTGPITVSEPETLQAVAVADGYTNSDIVSAWFNIGANPAGEWTWMGGNNDYANDIRAGWYGTWGIPDAANIPGARIHAMTWTDLSGNLWLFGGMGFDAQGTNSFLNDLWKFDPSTGLWTWMGGSSTVTHVQDGNGGMPGIYGEKGVAAASNVPGSRHSSATWIDTSGNLWLFGGLGFDANGTGNGYLNDLWKFDVLSNEWTWMGGSKTFLDTYAGSPGIYASFRSPSSRNVPGGRAEGAFWTDSHGHFWIFGGNGTDERNLPCYLNDLWQLDTATTEWEWMGGLPFCVEQQGGVPGIYGSLGIPAPTSSPWSISWPATWTDHGGNLWIFGGLGYDPSTTGYYLNDMFEYLPSDGDWMSTSFNGWSTGGTRLSVNGVRGKFSPLNIPGERESTARWTDRDGNFWLFGGYGLGNIDPLLGPMNDLWEFKPALNEWAWMGGDKSARQENVGQPGIYGSLGVPSTANLPGGTESAATWTDKDGNLWLFGTRTDSAGIQGLLNDLWEFSLTSVPAAQPPSPTATPKFSIAPGTYAAPQILTITSATPDATIYYTVNGLTASSSSPVYSGPIKLQDASDSVVALAVAKGHSVSSLASGFYSITNPAAASPIFSVAEGVYTAAQSVAIGDSTPNATIYYTTDGTAPTLSSTAYTTPITVSSSETIQAIATASGYSPSPVASATYTINLPPDFALGADATSLTISAGGQGSVTLSVTPQNGFNSAVTFACSGLPAGTTCGFNPSTVTPSGGTAAKTTLTIAASASAFNAWPARNPLVPAATLALAGLILFWNKGRRRTYWVPVLLLGAGIALVSACGGGSGGGGGTNPPPPTTATVTVTAASGTMQQTAKISLTVNH
jgi:N-acetylneuraminic acid mutarotase